MRDADPQRLAPADPLVQAERVVAAVAPHAEAETGEFLAEKRGRDARKVDEERRDPAGHRRRAVEPGFWRKACEHPLAELAFPRRERRHAAEAVQVRISRKQAAEQLIRQGP